MKLKWQQAPVKTQWGDDMVVASVAIDKDHTVCLYCEREQTPKVEAMFALAEQPAPSQYGSPELQAMIVARATEKNAAEQPAQQEPVGYVSSVQSNSPLMCGLSEWERKGLIPLYTSPQAQQEPVGYEKYAAIREGHRNACEEAYFGARPDLPLATSTLTAFRHGFDRGYDVEGKQHRNEWLIQLQDEIKRLQLASPQAQREPLTDEQVAIIYKAWHAVGADIAGLKWDDFVKHWKSSQHPCSRSLLAIGQRSVQVSTTPMTR